MSHIPGLKEELIRPRAKRSDRYKFSNELVYFQGSGQKIISKSCQIVIGDEVDTWSPEHPQNVRDLLKRTRSYSSSFAFLCCSPSTQNASIWQNFLKGSQGYFTLRCKGCEELTMRSCDVHNLQFESTYNEGLRTYVVKRGSERLFCPKCHHEHIEADKEWCISHGDFVHLIPELLEERPSFQVGALASQLPSLSWSEIANAALEAGKTADLEIQKHFDNSIRGLPFKQRTVTKDEISKLRDNHIWTTPPSLENVEMIFVTSDTMDEFSAYAVWAWGCDDSLYLLECGELQYIELDEDKRKLVNEERRKEGHPPVVTLEDILMKEFLVKDGSGLKPTFLVIDQGGHRGDDVKHFARMHRQVIMQKGTSLTSVNFKPSDKQERLYIVNEKFYKSTTIYYLYTQKNKEENFLWLYPEIDDEKIAELRDMRPDESSKWGSEPENWVSKTGKDHLFDCLKYAYFAKDYALKYSPKNRYRFAKAPSILKRFESVRRHEARIEQQTTTTSWFSI